jgi:hypothetical protein
MISASRIVRPDGEEKEVKNLGWVLRHWKDVKRFVVCLSLNPDDDCLLVAVLKDGRAYTSGFGARETCARFLDRPVFRGLPLRWFGEVKTV